MTQEEKQLLIKDLCARLPYKVKCFCKWAKEAPNCTVGCIQEISTFLLDELEIMDKPEYSCQVSEIKPYLRPISSITDDEINELDEVCDGIFSIYDTNIEVLSMLEWEDSFENILKGNDWLNKHHFDYRGLIPMGLALEAKDGMYKTK